MRRCGASVAIRAMASDSSSPRLLVTSECNSSRTMRRSPPNSWALSSWLSSSAICSGVVIRMLGGSRRWRGAARGRGIAGAGFDRDRQTHLVDRRGQIAGHVDRQRLERRDVEGVQALLGVVGEIVKRRQEAGKGLAGAGRGDQQRRGIALPAAPARRADAPAAPSPCGRTSRRWWDARAMAFDPVSSA